jgi:hypothetical protein
MNVGSDAVARRFILSPTTEVVSLMATVEVHGAAGKMLQAMMKRSKSIKEDE